MAGRYVSGEGNQSCGSPVIVRLFHSIKQMYNSQDIVSYMQHLGPDAVFSALAIVGVFETGRPLDGFGACAVLDDGAGISYGVLQFTHRSGALFRVAERYLRGGGTIGREAIVAQMAVLRSSAEADIRSASRNLRLRKALQAAAVTSEMKRAQLAAVLEDHLLPAIREFRRRGFAEPLSLAVIFDSMTHGSYERLARSVAERGERDWTCAYVHLRDRWLASVPRLRLTRYRTRFFVEQIDRGNWELALPVIANGRRITPATIDSIRAAFAAAELTRSFETPADGHSSMSSDGVEAETAAVPPSDPPTQPRGHASAADPSDDARPPGPSPESGGFLEGIETSLAAGGAAYDRAERAVAGVARRADSVKSLWAAVAGSAWQTAWAIAATLAGIPREAWLTAAVIVGALTAIYLYRQVALGRIRETK
jgi:hypothetical protein